MDKQQYDIIMEQANNKLRVALKNQLQADISCTTEEAFIAIDHLFDILDAHKTYKG